MRMRRMWLSRSAPGGRLVRVHYEIIDARFTLPVGTMVASILGMGLDLTVWLEKDKISREVLEVLGPDEREKLDLVYGEGKGDGLLLEN